MQRYLESEVIEDKFLYQNISNVEDVMQGKKAILRKTDAVSIARQLLSFVTGLVII